jgi:hypothetical protein
MRVGILLTYRKYLHEHITSLRREIWTHLISLTPPLFIDVSVPDHENEQLCFRVLGVFVLPLYYFAIGSWNCCDSVVKGKQRYYE